MAPRKATPKPRAGAAPKPALGPTARYAAFLRGVYPNNCKMADLAAAYAEAGLANPKTVASSGNVLFDAPAGADLAELEARCEAATEAHLGRAFLTMVRPLDAIRKLVADDPFARLAPGAEGKRVVSFLRGPPPRGARFPVSRDGATIHGVVGRAAFTTYLPSPKGPVFMVLIEKTLGEVVTTRTWDMLTKLAR